MMKRGSYFTTVWRGGDFKESPVEVNVEWTQDSTGELTLDTALLPAGLYFCWLQTGGGVHGGKFVRR